MTKFSLLLILQFLFLFPNVELFGQVYPDSLLICSINCNDSILDYTGNTNPKKYGIKLTSDKCGELRHACEFDGNNDYIEIGKFNELTDSLNSFCVSFWMKQHISEVSGYESIMGSLNSGSKTAFDIKVHHGSGNSFTKNGISLQIRDENNKYFTLTVIKIDSLFDGAWHHVVFNIIDSKSNRGTVYVDNLKVTTSSTTNTSPSNFANFQNNFCIGATNNRGTISKHFTGRLDDINLYSRSLDSIEIDTLFKQRCITYSTVYDTTKLITNDTISIFDTTNIIHIDTFYDIIEVYDTLLTYDTSLYFDTTIITSYDTIQINDTTTTFQFDTFYNVIDVFDTSLVILNIYDTINITTYDTLVISDSIIIHDTIHSTTIDTFYHIVESIDTITIIDSQIVYNILDSCESLIVKKGDDCLLHIYPNPLNSYNLEISDLCSNQSWDKIEISDALGKIVYRYDGIYHSKFNANLRRVSNGVYFLNLYKNDYLIHSNKLIINN